MAEERVPLILVVTLWPNPDRLDGFFEYEREASRIMGAHGGVIERVIRLRDGAPDTPFEIHIVRFPDEGAFERYRDDPERARLAAMRDEVMRRTEVLVGFDAPPYQ